MTIRAFFRNLAFAAGAVLIATGNGSTSELGSAAGDPLLTITGAISETNVGDAAVFDMEMLRGMPSTEFQTTTIWTNGSHSFKGVPLDALLKTVGASGKTLRAVALNDYAVEIPASDAREGGPIVAYEMDGSEMSRRGKGPLWIVYPYDSKATYQTEVIYSRSIWQLARIEILE